MVLISKEENSVYPIKNHSCFADPLNLKKPLPIFQRSSTQISYKVHLTAGTIEVFGLKDFPLK